MKNRTPLFFIFLFAIFISAVVLLTANTEGTNRPDYSVFSTNEKGISVLYEAFKKIDYPVSPYYEQINKNTGLEDIHVVVSPTPMYFTDSDRDSMLEWVALGGRLVFLEKSPFIFSNFEDSRISTDGKLSLYKHGFGFIVSGNPEGITNEIMKTTPTSGAVLQNIFNNWGYENIYFNEYAHGFRKEQTFFTMLPTGLKLLMYQGLLLILSIILLLGKRFGKPIPFYEETEREENEYLKSLAIIYKNAGKGEVILENYYESLIHYTSLYFNKSHSYVKENLLKLWKEGNLPKFNDLVQIEKEMKPTLNKPINTKKPKGHKEFVKNSKILINLIEIIKNRKGTY